MKHVLHADALPLGVRQESRIQGCCRDIRAGHVQLGRKKVPIDLLQQFLAACCLRVQYTAPQREPLGWPRLHEVHDKADAAQEGFVQVSFAVRGQDGNSLELLHPLQQVVNLDVGKAVVCVLDLGALAKQGVGLIEEQHHVGALTRVENLLKAFFSLADVFVDHAGKVDAEELHSQGPRYDLRSHGFSRAAGTGKHGSDPSPQGTEALEPPIFINLPAQPDLLFKLCQVFAYGSWKDDVIPSKRTDKRGEQLMRPRAQILLAYLRHGLSA